MNLFKTPFREESFDVVISNCVLHHTGDARGRFRGAVAQAQAGRTHHCRLHNSYARLPTPWRGRMFERFGPILYFLYSRLGSSRMNEGSWQAWEQSDCRAFGEHQQPTEDAHY
jgi:hypothetical protein